MRVGEFAVSVPTGTSPREDLVGLAATATPLASPVEAYFEVANRCNSKCATCPLTFSPQEDARQLSLDEFKSLVAQLPDLRRAVLQGIGEPLLNHELPAMIRHLDERGVYTVFNTNAALLTLSANGSIEDMQLVREDPLFGPAVLDALKSVQFAPAEIDGNPVPYWAIVEVVFSLGRPAAPPTAAVGPARRGLVFPRQPSVGR